MSCVEEENFPGLTLRDDTKEAWPDNSNPGNDSEC